MTATEVVTSYQQGNTVSFDFAGHPVDITQSTPSSFMLDTGWMIWDVAYVLLRYLEQNYNIKGTRILDLSAGTGILGICLAKAGALVTLTDTGEQVHLLNQNVSSNCPKELKNNTINTVDYAWGKDTAIFNDYKFENSKKEKEEEEKTEEPKEEKDVFDLICCSDLVYPAVRYKLNKELIHSFRLFCQMSKKVEILLAFEKRCDKDEEAFIEECKEWFECIEVTNEILKSCVKDVKKVGMGMFAAITAMQRRENDFRIVKLRVKN